MPSIDSVQETGSENRKKLLLVVTDRDVVFNCAACHGELVVDRDGSGMEVSCPHCGHRLVVPSYKPRAASTATAATSQASQGEPVAPALLKRAFDHTMLSPEQLARRFDELKHQLKENRSQDTEMRGHVNRATIELHRLQLRLKKLEERHGDIQAELETIQAKLTSREA